MKALLGILHSWKQTLPAALVAATLASGSASYAQATQLGSGPLTVTHEYPGIAKSPADPNPTTIASGFSVATSDGTNALTFTSSDGSDFTRLDASLTFSAFAPGTKLIETNSGAPDYNANGPMTITFQNPVTEFGLYAQNYLLDKEAFQFTVYSGGTSEGTFDVGNYANPQAGGIDNTQGNGAKVFLGAFYQGGITSVQIFSSSYIAGNPQGNPDSTNDFLVGTDAAPVPEATNGVSFGLLLGIGALAIAARRRRARQSGPASA